MSLLRGAAGQCIGFGLTLFMIFGLPGVISFVLFHRAFAAESIAGWVDILGLFFGVIAVVGAMPAVAAAAIAWRIFLRRHKGTPPPEVVPYCWIVTLAGAYLLIPFWILLLAGLLQGCDLAFRWSALETCATDAARVVGQSFGVTALGFLVTVPYVAPMMYLGTWLWVRKIRPRLMAL